MTSGQELLSAASKVSGPVRHSQTMYCDIGDVIFYLKHHCNVSGIQRVISSVVLSVANSHRFENLVWCMVEPIANEMRQIESRALIRLVQEITSRSVERVDLDSFLADIERGLFRCEPQSGDTFLIMGAFWVFDHASAMLLRMRRKGVRTALLVYDLIPIQHPEFCERSLTTVFSRQMRSLLPLLDCAITISNHVAQQFEKYAALSNVRLPIAPVLLGHDTPAIRQSTASGRKTDLDIDGEYVLVVGTIEIRKNHGYLLHIWRHLLLERDVSSVPKLVFVGRQGWRVNDLIAQLDATDYLDGHVIVLESVDDIELNDLYLGCLFTMFVSYTEGWGLPVGESLSRGKLCVASNATSIPEIGGDFPLYIDPYNVSQGRQMVEHLLDNREYLAMRTKAIVDEFRPRSWDDYTNTLLDMVVLLANKVEPKKASVALIPEARWMPLGNTCETSLDAGLACTSGWYPREDWGCWMSARDAWIEFQGKPGTTYRFIADVSLPPWLHEHGLKVYANGKDEVKIDRLPTCGGMFKATAHADEDGVVAFRFHATGPALPNPGDPRILYVGLKRFIFYSIDDPIMYARGIEQLTLAPLNLMA